MLAKLFDQTLTFSTYGTITSNSPKNPRKSFDIAYRSTTNPHPPHHQKHHRTLPLKKEKTLPRNPDTEPTRDRWYPMILFRSVGINNRSSSIPPTHRQDYPHVPHPPRAAVVRRRPTTPRRRSHTRPRRRQINSNENWLSVRAASSPAGARNISVGWWKLHIYMYRTRSRRIRARAGGKPDPRWHKARNPFIFSARQQGDRKRWACTGVCVGGWVGVERLDDSRVVQSWLKREAKLFSIREGIRDDGRILSFIPGSKYGTTMGL